MEGECRMYINPVTVGVVGTLLVEIGMLAILAVVVGTRKGRK